MKDDFIEKELERIYVPMIMMTMGMAPSQARNFFLETLNGAKEASLKDVSNTPENFGDILLDEVTTNNNIKIILENKRKEGVRDEDIRWWWNMRDFERRLMIIYDDIFRIASILKSTDEGMSLIEATKKMKKYFPFFGEPSNTDDIVDKDRPLPFELKDRVNIYTSKRTQDTEQFKKEVEDYTSMNAFLRNEIKKGNL